MGLRVIGAGFGRTGTLSLKNALEKIGFGPCYHMMEVVPRPEHVAMWHGFAFGKPMNWDLLFKDFQSTVDWPACNNWRELSEHYPEAKVLLSVRNPEDWWRSMHDTIYQPMTMHLSEKAPLQVRQQLEMARQLIAEGVFNGRFEDKNYAIEMFSRHVNTVKETIDPKRLLVMDVREGWEPLCRFLGVPVPAEPFPRLNDTATTQAMIRSMRESF